MTHDRMTLIYITREGHSLTHTHTHSKAAADPPRVPRSAEAIYRRPERSRQVNCVRHGVSRRLFYGNISVSTSRSRPHCAAGAHPRFKIYKRGRAFPTFPLLPSPPPHIAFPIPSPVLFLQFVPSRSLPQRAFHNFLGGSLIFGQSN